MGVHGLWRLLDSFGQVTQPENWRGRRVAIDASIWMAQFRAQAKLGTDVEQEVLEGFFVRILKLFFYGIQPVFVFDGPATSAKSAEHRRRQLRRNAVTQVYLQRRARQIMTAQVTAGTLDLAQLPTIDGEMEEEGKDEALGAGDGDWTATTETAAGSDRVPQRRHRNRARRLRRLRIAPDSVSEQLTHSFLHDAVDFIAMRKQGEQQLVENSLRSASSSLFMGPRRVFGSPVASGGPARSRGAAATASAPEVVSLDSDDSCVDLDDDDDDKDEEDEDSGSDSAVRIPSCEISVSSAGDGSVEAFSQPPVPASSCRREVSLPGTTTTTHPVSFLQNMPMTPPTKHARLEEGSPSSHSSITVSSEGDEGSVWSTSDTSSDAYSHSEDQGVSAWMLDPHGLDEDRFLWNPNTQMCAPALQAAYGGDGPAGTLSHALPSQSSDSEFVPVKELAASRDLLLPPAAESKPAPAANNGSATATVTEGVDVNFPLPRPEGGSPWARPATAAHANNTPAEGHPIPFELLGLVQLLRCCGVPYVLSPAEADAQCALLAREGLVDAVFSEDSDVVVHGAPILLRGFFAANRHVVEYRCEDLATCGLDKRVLVCLAYLLGCDYTEGVPGIGLAGALDVIIAAWPPAGDGGGSGDDPDSATAFVCGLLERWRRITAEQSRGDLWPACFDSREDLSFLQLGLLDAHKAAWTTLSVPDRFPSRDVAEAFFGPPVDADTTPFAHAAPDWPRMRSFAAGRGLFASSWVKQRFELAQREWEAKHAAARADGGGDSPDSQGRVQRRLDDYGVRARVSEKWAYKKQPPKRATALAQLRTVQSVAAPL